MEFCRLTAKNSKSIILGLERDEAAVALSCSGGDALKVPEPADRV